MTRLEWLEKRHREIDEKVTQLEAEREHTRSQEHKNLLVDLKKQRLAVKEEIAQLNLI